MTINQFNKQNDFLSIYYPINLELYGIKFKTLEHYYFGFKCNCFELMQDVSQHATPEKRLNELIEEYSDKVNVVRPDWEDVRQQILGYGVYMKFLEEPCRSKLLELPKDTEFIFGFTNPRPSDELLFLGHSLITCEGCNTYGKLISSHRSYIESQNIHQSLNETYVISPITQ